MDHTDDSDQNTGPRQENSPETSEKTLKADRPAKTFAKKFEGKPGKDAKANLKTERIAKVLARAGLASRREVERLIGLGKIAVNGRILETPAVLVSTADIITVEGQPIGKAEATRLWRYHKPVGLLTTNRDPQGRPTVFDKLPQPMPRVISIGRLDINSEGLLLLTNDGELARALELPATGWVRRYRVRALGHTSQARLDGLKDGTTVDGVIYGPIEATLDKVQDKADGRANVWITIAITEGKNREVRRVLESIGLKVNRLIRLAYGPFQLGTLEPGEVEEVGPRVIRELLSGMIDPRNLPPEGATQTEARPGSRFSRDRGEGAPRDGASRDGSRREGANRFAGAGTDRPRTGAKKPFPEKREYRERDFDERPRFEGDGTPRDRRESGPDQKSYAKKPYAKKPYAAAEGAERRPYSRPRPEGTQGEDRPRKTFGGPRPERTEGSPRGPKREFTPRGDGPSGGAERKGYGKPRFDRPDETGGERPRKSYGSKPSGGRSFGDKPSGGKPFGDRTSNGKSGGYKSDRPAGARSEGRPEGKPEGRSYAGKPAGASRTGWAKPGGAKPGGAKPGFGRPKPPRDRG